MKARILAIDYGTKRIGLAISDPLGLTSHPLPYLQNKGADFFLLELKKIIAERGAQKVVMGLPKSLDGTLGELARQCKNLAERIQTECGIAVELYDERFSSREAETFLVSELNVSRKKRKEIRDSLAACFILESYLKSQGPL